MGKLTAPDCWVVTNLGSVVDYGKTQKCELADINGVTWVVELEDIEKDTSRIISRGYTPEREFKSSKNRFNKGDVLYGKLRPYLNKVVMADEDGVCSTEIIPVNAEPLVSNKYIFHWFKCHHFLDYVNDVSYGVNMPRLGTKDGLNAPFILPPFAEQKEIADRLDKLLAQVEATQARLARIPYVIKQFRQSVLTAAMSGKLTETWREYNECISDDLVSEIKKARFKLWKEWQLEEFLAKGKTPQGNWESKYSEPDQNRNIENLPVSWSFLSWNEISIWITYGFTKPMPHVDTGPLIITAKNVRDGVVEFDNTHRTTIEAFSSLRPKDKPTAGDILIVKDGATTGRASIAPTTLDEYCISQSVAVVWLKYCPINRKYLLWNVQSQETQKKIKEVMAGMAMPHLSITDFGRMLVPIPPSDEIDEIVRRVEQLFAYADTLEQQAKAAKERVDKLTQAILAKAFRGELTADWRAANPDLISGDNSAAALLARIQAERAQSAKKSRKSTQPAP
jgi:type I restriction enzyme, S subunit